jgi:hypothetical protein
MAAFWRAVEDMDECGDGEQEVLGRAGRENFVWGGENTIVESESVDLS